MDISGDVANLLRRTHAKNLVTTARTIHLPEQKETQNCLADCLTKASAKADNLITAVQTGMLLNVDIHLDFRTLMEHKAFLSTWCKTFLHTKGEGSLPPEHSQDLSYTHVPRRTMSGDVCRDSAAEEAK